MDTESILAALETLGEDARPTLDFLRRHRTRIGFRRQGMGTAAMWTLDGGIYLNPRHFSPDVRQDDPTLLCLVVHEGCHLRQGPLTALSVYGELEAWQLDLRLRSALGLPLRHPALVELLGLPLGYDRSVLQCARQLMRAYAGPGYRIDLLPLYPLLREVRFWITRKEE